MQSPDASIPDLGDESAASASMNEREQPKHNLWNALRRAQQAKFPVAAWAGQDLSSTQIAAVMGTMAGMIIIRSTLSTSKESRSSSQRGAFSLIKVDHGFSARS